ncbi:MAG TPA: tetratricopeptide repeat protein [Bryobacteraceae bacterium]|nr:tetratricopeptide repeat protein [Bryobacteraceae bacterium]
MKFLRILIVVPLLLLSVSCSRDPKALVANGNKYFAREKYKEASIMYRRALQKDRKNAEAWYRLGLVDLRTRQYAEAAGAFTRAAQLDPSNVDAAGKLADLYFAASMFDAAHRKQDLGEVKNIASELLRRNPHSYDGHRLSGYIALTENKLQDAVDHFNDANQEKPDQPEVMLALCQALAAVNRRPEAEKLARQLIDHHRNDAAAYDFLVRLYITENRRDDAEAALKEKVANNPSVGAYQIQLARFYLALGKPDQSQAVLNHLTSDLKTYPDAWMLVGEYYQTLNTPNHAEQALNAFQHGEEADPKNKVAYQKRRAQALITANRIPEAGALVDQILKEQPNDPEAIAVRAAMDIHTGQKDKVLKAINALQPLVGKYPNVAATSMLHLNLGRAYLMKAGFDAGDPDPAKRQNDLDQARIQLEQTIQNGKGRSAAAETLLADVQMQRGDYAKVAQLADDILNNDPMNAWAHLTRAKALIAMREPEKAREDLTNLLDQNPKNTDARYELALLDYQQKKYKDAEAGFDKVLQAGDQRGYAGVMESRLAQGEYASVLNDLQAKLATDPKNSQLRLALAGAQTRAGKLQDAIASYRQVLDSSPNALPAARADLMLRIAAVQRVAGDTNGAMQTLQNARRTMPSNSAVMTQIALLYDTTGQKEQARDEYEKVLKIDPDNVTALNNLAFLKAEDSVDLDRALTLAQRARQKQPDNLDIQDTLALIYLRKNLTEESLRLMNELVDKDPRRSTFHYHRALALVQKGDNVTAKRELNDALQDKPPALEQGKIRELIAKIG